MNPSVGLQPDMNWQQGLGGPSFAVAPSPQQSLLNTMGPWSQLAYQMAGSPQQGGLLPSVTPPSLLPGTGGGSTTSNGSNAGQALLGGLLGTAARAPGVASSVGKALGGILGTDPATYAAGLYGSVAPSISAATSAATASTAADVAASNQAWLASQPAATAFGDAPAVAAPVGGLLGGAASGAGSALGAGAPGVFATGNAAAGSAGAASGLTGAAAALPIAGFGALAGLALTKGLAADAVNNQGNDAMKAWMQGTGATFKAAPTQSNSGQNTFGTVNQYGNTMGQGVSTSPGTWIGADGKSITASQAHDQIIAYAKAHGLPYGNI